MTNYNERLDKILFESIESASTYTHNVTAEEADYIQDRAKQAITSLIKELVAEAKPHKRLPDDSPSADEDLVNYGYNEAINQFEQNLLKELEEV